MAINLQKGQRISLAKTQVGLSQLMCGLGWDVAKPQNQGLFGLFQNTPAYDLDSSVICLNAEGQLSRRDSLVYYGNLRHSSGAIWHSGDNLTGEGEGDDEQIFILNKGGRINLSKESPGLKYAGIGLGWDLNSSRSGEAFDLDASVFMLGSNRKIPNELFFVFYNNLKSPDGAIEHFGDSRTGEGGGDDESIEIDLSRVLSAIEEILFVVTIHDSEARHQNFGQIQNAFIRMYDATTEKEVARYNLQEQFSRETAIEFGKLYRKSGEWFFQALGRGYCAGLQDFVNQYAS
jgi:tellurium resistance protein TerD